MKANLVFGSIAVVFSSLAAPLRAEKGGELLGHKVMLVAANVTFRTAPSADASVGKNTTGGYLVVTVDGVEGDWVRLKKNWVRRDEVVPVEAAFDFFSGQIERQPTAFAYASRSSARLKRREFEGALEDANEAVQRDPNLPCGYIARARVKLANAELDEPLGDYEKALTLDPKLKVALSGREIIHQMLRDQYADLANPKAALAPAGGKDDLPSEDRRLTAVRLFERALSTGEKGDHRQAIAELDEAVRLAPELRTATFFSRRSDHFVMLEEYEKAKADLQQAISLEPNNADHYSSLANACSMQDDLDGAIANLERAYEICKPGAGKISGYLPGEGPWMQARSALIDAYVERANNRSTNGDSEGATADFDRAVELDPESAQTFIQRSVFLALQGKYEQAFKDCDAAIRLEPGSVYALCSRGAVYQTKGDMAKAIDAFNQVVILFPQKAYPLSVRALAWKELGDLAKALDDINQAISVEPENGFWYTHRAEILRELKRDDEAAADLKKAEELFPQMVRRPTEGQ